MQTQPGFDQTAPFRQNFLYRDGFLFALVDDDDNEVFHVIPPNLPYYF
jgi:hypothetical protein